jgi:transposase
MDKAYEGDETRKLAAELGFSPVVPPKNSRTEPWEHDKELYKKRNEVERLFRRRRASAVSSLGLTNWMACSSALSSLL